MPKELLDPSLAWGNFARPFASHAQVGHSFVVGMNGMIEWLILGLFVGDDLERVQSPVEPSPHS